MNLVIEDLRIMIAQNFSLAYLIPLAIEKLKENVLAEGDFYPGDLLEAVTKIDDGFWIENANYKRELEAIILKNRTMKSYTSIYSTSSELRIVHTLTRYG